MRADGHIFEAFVNEKKMNKTQLASDLGMSKQNLYQLFKSKEFKADTINNIEKITGIKWDKIKLVNIDNNVSRETNQDKGNIDDEVIQQPIFQVVLNLSYAGRKNADSIDTMAQSVKTIAATNQRNTDIIAALVAEMFPNSKFVAQLISSQDHSQQPHKSNVPSIEEMLGPEGIELLKKQWLAGKKKEEDIKDK